MSVVILQEISHMKKRGEKKKEKNKKRTFSGWWTRDRASPRISKLSAN